MRVRARARVRGERWVRWWQRKGVRERGVETASSTDASSGWPMVAVMECERVVAMVVVMAVAMAAVMGCGRVE